MRELKPCPFCGGEAKVFVCDNRGDYATDDLSKLAYYGREMTHCLIKCPKCRIKTSAYLTRGGAFRAWNRRAT